MLLVGETGVGKEYIARQIHRLSSRSRHPLVVADCCVIVDSLLESELYGHARGAFTGANQARSGLIDNAHNSTLLVDRLDNMSARMQASLLRVLETGDYRPVGAEACRHSDFRAIAAASDHMDEAVADGSFRLDLYYRLSTLKIVVPPLRERGTSKTG